MGKMLIANPEIVFREEIDEAILFDPRTGAVKILNETGAFIYQLLDGKHSQNDVVESLMERYDTMDREQVEKDLAEFLGGLRESGLIGELE